MRKVFIDGVGYELVPPAYEWARIDGVWKHIVIQDVEESNQGDGK